MIKSIAILVVVLAVMATSTAAKKIESCEVCEGVINKLRKILPENASPEEIEAEFKYWCQSATGKEEKFCYYVGGAKTSATYIVPEMAKPMSWHLPADKICREKLLKKDPQICDLKYDKQIDVHSVDLKSLKVKDLKKILSDWGVDTRLFTEKSEFIQKIEELKNEKAPKEDL